MLVTFVASIFGLLLFGLVTLSVVSVFRRVAEVTTAPEDAVNLKAPIDELLAEMSARGFHLHVGSTRVGAVSTLFYLDAIDLDGEERVTAPTLEESIRQAASRVLAEVGQ